MLVVVVVVVERVLLKSGIKMELICSCLHGLSTQFISTSPSCDDIEILVTSSLLLLEVVGDVDGVSLVF